MTKTSLVLRSLKTLRLIAWLGAAAWCCSFIVDAQQPVPPARPAPAAAPQQAPAPPAPAQRAAAAVPRSSEAAKYGVAVKRPVLQGACKSCPWGSLADVIQKMMAP